MSRGVTRNPDDEKAGAGLADRKYLRTGFSEALTAKLSRLAGADAVHTGTAGSECFEVAEYSLTHVTLVDYYRTIRRCFAVAEGDLQLVNVAENVRFMSNDVIIETSSGIANHPSGIRAGARAFRALAGCIRDEMNEHQMDNVINVLRSRMPEIEQSLATWHAINDQRIRSGWSPDASWKQLEQDGMVTGELRQIWLKRSAWNPRAIIN